jgi:hypothetical protein
MTGNFGFVAVLIFSQASLRFDRYGVAALFEIVPSKLSLACSDGSDLAARLCRLLHQGEVRSITSLARMLSDFWRYIEPFRPLGGGLFQSPMEKLATPPGAVNIKCETCTPLAGYPQIDRPQAAF